MKVAQTDNTIMLMLGSISVAWKVLGYTLHPKP